MLTLHHLENSQSIRILWLLEELGVPYEFKMYDRDPVTKLAPMEYKQVSPLGTAPVITDGDLVLAESNAIIDYIVDNYEGSRLRPVPGSPERERYLFWFHFAQGSLQPLLTMKYVLERLVTAVPFFLKPILRTVVGKANSLFVGPRMNLYFAQMEQDLATSTWFAGDTFTAADIAMGYCVEVAAVRADMDERYPHTQRFLKQMRERPSYQAALRKDGKFNPLP